MLQGNQSRSLTLYRWVLKLETAAVSAMIRRRRLLASAFAQPASSRRLPPRHETRPYKALIFFSGSTTILLLSKMRYYCERDAIPCDETSDQFFISIISTVFSLSLPRLKRERPLVAVALSHVPLISFVYTCVRVGFALNETPRHQIT